MNGRCIKIHKWYGRINYTDAARECESENGHLFNIKTKLDENTAYRTAISVCMILQFILPFFESLSSCVYDLTVLHGSTYEFIIRGFTTHDFLHCNTHSWLL